jgi:hypothetical protein
MPGQNGCGHGTQCQCYSKAVQIRRSGREPRTPAAQPDWDDLPWDTLRAVCLARPQGGHGAWRGGRFVLIRAGLCERCGQEAATDPHHRWLKAEGGPDLIANLAALDRACHDWCHRHPAAARDAGWIVATGKDPAARGVELHTGQLVRFSGSGGYLPARAA